MYQPIIRYCPPTMLDREPSGTQWHVMHESDDGYDIYIQLSDNKESPDWQRMGIFLEKALQNFIHDKTFLNQCMKLYINNKTALDLKSYIERDN